MKKYISTAFMILFASFLLAGQAVMRAQDSTQVHVQTPQITMKLPLGDTLKVNGVMLTFYEVIEDSRCPTDATCIWAGQAKVRVRVQAKGGPMERKEILFNPGLQGSIFLVETKDCRIVVDNLYPYPIDSQEEAGEKGYYLSVREVPLRKENSNTDPKNGF